jgi:hypothetical protein
MPQSLADMIMIELLLLRKTVPALGDRLEVANKAGIAKRTHESHVLQHHLLYLPSVFDLCFIRGSP